MTPDPQLEAWLSTATAGLALVSVAQVRAEISSHYESALAAGRTPQEAIDSLGTPKRANLAYRRVLLTEVEARAAVRSARARLNSSKTFSSLNRVANWVLVPTVLLSFNASRWVFWFCLPPVVLDAIQYFFPSTTVLRTRVYLGARVAVVSWMAWMWYQHDSLLRVFGVFAIAGGLIGLALAYQRRLKRKLAGKDPASLILGPLPTTTPAETVLRCGGPAMMGMMLTFAGVSTFFQPVIGGPLLLAWAVCFLVPLLVSIDTPESIHVFRQFKWTAIALAPAGSYLLSSLSQDSLTKWASVKVTCVGVVGLVLVEIGRASFRRKLPIERWPKWLRH